MYSTPEQDAEMVIRVQAGDTGAFDELVKAHERAAFATALGSVNNLDDAKDIVQESFLRAYCRLGQLQTPERFGLWLRSIVRRLVTDWIRARREGFLTTYTTDMDESGHAGVTLPDPGMNDAAAEVWRVLSMLPGKYREVVILHHLQGHSYERIARYTDLPVSTVRGRLHQARTRLKEAFSALEGKETIMKSTSVAKDVAGTVCRIHKENIEQTVSLDGMRHVVITADIATDLEICPTDGDAVKITGTKSSIGRDENEARRFMDSLKLTVKQCDTPDENLILRAREAAFDKTAAYPELADEEQKRVDEVIESLSSALVISAERQNWDQIQIPQDAFTTDVRKAFQHCSIQSGIVSGWPGYLDLVIAVPPDVNVTVVRQPIHQGKRNLIWGLKGDLTIVNGVEEELRDLEGNVNLLNTHVSRAENITGTYHQTLYDCGYGGWDGIMAQRGGASSMVLSGIRGTVDIDVIQTNLEVSSLKGEVSIRNRYGTTRAHLTEEEKGSRYNITTDGGETLFFVKEDAVDEFDWGLYTVCGTIGYDAFKTCSNLYTGNDLRVIIVTTVEQPRFHAGFGNRAEDLERFGIFARSVGGSVSVEKSK